MVRPSTDILSDGGRFELGNSLTEFKIFSGNIQHEGSRLTVVGNYNFFAFRINDINIDKQVYGM